MGANDACEDIDECAVGTSATEIVDCGVGTCLNTDGSYTCDCPAGYVLSDNGLTCVDEDECTVGSDTCDSYKCINTEGSFICDCADPEICPAGTSETAAACVDDAICDSCQCNVGYEYDDGGVCVDIDECALDVDGLLCVNGDCVNTSGDYQCTCHAGFEEAADFKSCTDIDECFNLMDQCPIHSDCFNTPGGYLCVDLVCNKNDFPADWHPCPDNAPLPCEYRMGQDIQVDIESCPSAVDPCITETNNCGKVHCIAQGNDFNCGCIEPVHPYGWSVHKLKLSVNEGWAMETAEGARAKCHSLGYEMLQLRYKYQFDSIIDFFGADKVDNTWAGTKYAETPDVVTPFNWVTYIDNDLVEYKTENKTIWHDDQPSNNDEDNHDLCGQFMDGRIDDSYCALKKNFICFDNPVLLDCGCTPGDVAAANIHNVEKGAPLAVCELESTSEGGKGAIWTLVCDDNNNGRQDNHEYTIPRLEMADNTCKLAADLSCNTEIAIPFTVEQKKKCHCSKYIEDIAEISCAGTDLYVCRGTDGHLHRIFVEADKCSDVINDAGICVKKGQSFSNAQEEEEQEQVVAEAAVAADAGAVPALEVSIF